MPAQDHPDIRISKEGRDRIGQYLYEEIDRSKRQRKTKEKEWREINELYDKAEMEEKKDFPFKGAAHLMLPVMATFTEAMFARATGTIWAPSDPFSAKPIRKDYVNHVRPLRQFMTWTVKEELELEEKSKSVLMEMFKLGTGVNKVVYAREPYIYFEFDPVQEEWVIRTDTGIDNPQVIPVALDDYFFPMEARNREEQYWEAHRFRLTFPELKKRESQGKYKDVDRIQSQTSELSDMEKERLERQGISATHTSYDTGPDRYDIWEVWFDYAFTEEEVKGTNVPFDIPVKLMCYYHWESRTLLRLQHNWMPFQLSPFDVVPLVFVEHSVYGTGVGHMALPFQKELSTMHNQRLDGVTLENSTMVKRKASARIYGPIVIKPGGELVVDEMDDAIEFQLGGGYNSTIAEERETMAFLERRIGWQEYQATENISAQPATSTLTLMQEKMRRFDSHIANIRNYLASVMVKCLLLYKQYYPDGKAFMVQGQDGLYTEQLFQFDGVDFLNGIGVQVTATTSVTSRDVERQSKVQMFSLLQQYYANIEQRFIAAQDPQIPPAVKQVLMAIIVGLSEFVLEILEDFNIRIADELTLGFSQLRDVAIEQAAIPPVSGPGGAGGLESVAGASEAGAGGGGEGAAQSEGAGSVPALPAGVGGY